MRVLNLVHQYLPEFVGGTELYTQALTAELARRGWNTGIFFRSYAQGQRLESGHREQTRVYAASAGRFSPTRRFLATWHHAGLLHHWQQALADFKPDLVHVQHLMGLPAALLHTLRRQNIPYVITLLDYWWVCANANLLTNYDGRACDGPRACINCTRCAVARQETRVAWGAAPLLWPMLAHRNRVLHDLLGGAAGLLAASDFVGKWYAHHGAPAAHLRTTRWGVIPPHSPVRASPDKLSPDKRARFTLLYVGGLASNKGVHIVLEALQGMGDDLEFQIAGDPTTHPDYSRELEARADGRVRFLGRLDREQVWQAMADADVVVVPSLWHETFCLVAYEALTVGTPVLASAMGALPEAVRDGVDGLLLPPGDVAAWRTAIQSLVDSPARLARLRKGILPPREFAVHVAEIEAIYREVLGSPGPNGQSPGNGQSPV